MSLTPDYVAATAHISDAEVARDLDYARHALRDMQIQLRETQQAIADCMILIFKLEQLQAARKETPTP